MKEYENVNRNYLIRRMPAILRLDGKAFHTFTRKFNKPFDNELSNCMISVMQYLIREMQTAVFGYTQSDEMSFLLKDYLSLETQAWFGGNAQKIVSVSAAIASVQFNQYNAVANMAEHLNVYPVFDARIFNIPKEDVTNYFLWRQQDATRNSINSTGQAHFSHKELLGKSQKDVLDMLHAKGINWNETPVRHKRGTACYYEGPAKFMNTTVVPGNTSRGELIVDTEMPIITENRDYIERHVQ